MSEHCTFARKLWDGGLVALDVNGRIVCSQPDGNFFRVVLYITTRLDGSWVGQLTPLLIACAVCFIDF